MFSPQTVILENSPNTGFENDQTRSNRAPVEPSRIQNDLNLIVGMIFKSAKRHKNSMLRYDENYAN